VIRKLLHEWELRHAGVSASQKKQGLERVLINFASDTVLLQQKLNGLVDSWGAAAERSSGPVNEAAPEGPPAPPEAPAMPIPPAPVATFPQVPVPSAPPARKAQAILRDMLVQAMTMGVMPRFVHAEDIANEVTSLQKGLAQHADARTLEDLAERFRRFWIKLELRGKRDDEIVQGLLRLMNLLMDNVGELLVDESWMSGQISVVRDVIAQPLTPRNLYDAERNLKTVIYKQGTLKHGLTEAKDTFKNMLALFIGRMGEITEGTRGYQDKLEYYSGEIKKSDDIGQLNSLLASLMDDTRSMQVDAMRSHEELVEVRSKAEVAEQRIRQLEHELENVSELVREDYLTGSLNRRGLDDALQREFARAGRSKSPLCAVLLDIDHFKRFNDTHGHEAGDGALVHLVKVIKEMLRPSDVIARLGGEEFVIILPDTQTDDAISIMVRMQRELTKKYFLRNNERLLITFSAGVAKRTPNESPAEMLARADIALYEAKAAGRNRVLSAEASLSEAAVS
ncbi:MAG: GGDEF domain-containing protein, partial [Burkholderiales bacterium]